MGELRVQIVLILGLAAANFFLHSRVLTGQAVSLPVAYVASAADIAVISLIVVSQGGFESNLYVFYFPALLAISVTFPSRIAAVFAAGAIAAYGLISLGTLGDASGAALITRMLILGGTAVCGNIYWRIERDRRLAAGQTREVSSAGVQDEVIAH